LTSSDTLHADAKAFAQPSGSESSLGLDVGLTRERGNRTGCAGNLQRRLVLFLSIRHWFVTSLQQRLFKAGGRLVRHARYFVLQLAESYLTSNLFRQILGRIARLARHPT